ncbi:hypothetical protein ACWD4O_47160 [Streptomyces sp. NPDC002623]
MSIFATVLSIMGALLYGIARFGNAAFYTQLGTSPDEVGIDPTVLLGRVAGVFLIFLVVVALYSISVHFAMRDKTPWWASLLGFAAAMLLLGVLIFGFFTAASYWWAAGILVLSVIFLTFMTGVLDKNPNAYRDWMDKAKARRAATVTAALLFVLAVFATAGISGYRAARHIENGEVLPCSCLQLWSLKVNYRWFAGTAGFLGINPQHAYPMWISPTIKGEERTRLMRDSLFHLGTNNGTHYLFDAETQGVLRIPAPLFIFSTSAVG